jgi:hypothetical protein
MTYLVFCTFDLKSARREDHLYLYVDLAKLGLRKSVKSDDGRSFNIPATAVMGMFDGGSVNEVRSSVVKSVQEVFKTRGYSGDFFVVVSGDWACGGGAS